MIINYVSVCAWLAIILTEKHVFQTSEPTRNAKTIKYTKMEDAFALKDFSLLEICAIFAHLTRLMIYLGLDVFVPKDIIM